MESVSLMGFASVAAFCVGYSIIGVSFLDYINPDTFLVRLLMIFARDFSSHCICGISSPLLLSSSFLVQFFLGFQPQQLCDGVRCWVYISGLDRCLSGRPDS